MRLLKTHSHTFTLQQLQKVHEGTSKGGKERKPVRCCGEDYTFGPNIFSLTTGRLNGEATQYIYSICNRSVLYHSVRIILGPWDCAPGLAYNVSQLGQIDHDLDHLLSQLGQIDHASRSSTFTPRTDRS